MVLRPESYLCPPWTSLNNKAGCVQKQLLPSVGEGGRKQVRKGAKKKRRKGERKPGREERGKEGRNTGKREEENRKGIGQ